MLVRTASSTGLVVSFGVVASTNKQAKGQDTNSGQEDKSGNGETSLPRSLTLAGTVPRVAVVVAIVVAAIMLAVLVIIVPADRVAKETAEKASADDSGQPQDEGNAHMSSGVDARLPFLAQLGHQLGDAPDCGYAQLQGRVSTVLCVCRLNAM